MKFFTAAKLGPTRSKTPEGFLVCESVRVARTGEMLYSPEEIGLEPGADGVVRLCRDSVDLFAADCLASFEGKPVLGEHTEATPDNWQSLAWGHMQNVRAGDGADAGYMLADLVVNRPDGIAAIEAGREEVSLFYDFDFVPTAKGAGRQTNIRGNHVAVVEAGRCGPTCRIGDHQPTKQVLKMSKLPGWARLFGHAIKAGDEDAAAEILAAQKTAGDSAPVDPITAALTSIQATQKTMLQGLALAGAGKRFKLGDSGEIEEEKAEDEDDEDKDKAGDEDEDYDKMKSGDSGRAALRAEWQSVLSLAEILAPGCPNRLPAFDSLSGSGVTKVKAIRDSICRCRRAAMDHAMGTETGRAVLQPLLQGRALDAIPCDQQATLFTAAAEMMRQRNNHTVTVGDSTGAGAFVIPDQSTLFNALYGQRH